MGLGAPVSFATNAQFIATLGVNTHMSQGYSPSEYSPLLTYLGVPNVRDQMTTLANYEALPAGTRICFCPGGGTAISDAITLATGLANAGILLAVEGANEPNNFPFTYNGTEGGDSTTWVPVADYQRDLYAAVKANGPTANTPVFHTSETGAETNDVGMQWAVIPPGAGALLPDGTVYADYCNVHNYVIGTANTYIDNQAWFAAEPSTPDAGSSVDGFYANCMQTWWAPSNAGYTTAQAAAGIPKVTTETGWDSVSNPGNYTPSQRIQGVVLVNTYLAQFARGWSYTFIYEMVDGEGSSGNQGLFTSAYAPKLAATYIQTLTTILKNGMGGSFTPTEFGYTVSGAPSTVHYFLLQKNSAVYNLMIWGESAAGTVTDVTINFEVQVPLVNVFDVTAGTAATQTATNASSLVVPLSDHALIVELNTGAYMSGSTILTPYQVDATLFQDGQPEGAIDPADVRQLNDSLAALPISSTQTGSYTFQVIDRGCIVLFSSSNAGTFTVPANTFVTGSVVCCRAVLGGQLTIAAGSGLTLSVPSTLTLTPVQYATVCIHFTSATTATLM